MLLQIVGIVFLYVVIQSWRWNKCRLELNATKRRFKIPKIDLFLSYIMALIWPFNVEI